MARNLLDELLGLGEAGLTLGTGAVAGAVGMPYGLYKGITGGGYGTPAGVRQAQREAEAFMQRNTYQPRTQSGQGLLESLGQAMTASKLPPILPEAMALGSIPRQAYLAQAERKGMDLERAVAPAVERTLNRGGFPAGLLQGMSRGTVSPLDVYHGTPYTLPPTARNPLGEFDASKIGTGEGAQSYGYGIYTAENPAVGKGYQIALAPEKRMTSLTDRAKLVRVGDKTINPDTFDIDISQELIDAAKLGKNEFINFANQRKSRWQQLANDESYKYKTYAQDKLIEYNNLIKEAKKSSVSYTGGGNLYKADLPDEMIPKMLDYDAPMSEQSTAVQKILLPYQKEIGGSFGTGEQTLKAIAFERRMKGLDDSPAAVAKQLREMGIPGVKYLDEGSRSPKYKGDSAYLYAANDFKSNNYSLSDAFEGMKQAYKNANPEELRDALSAAYTPKTRNFVTFPGEEKNLRILERNGLLGD
jgi:hypothetical protein